VSAKVNLVNKFSTLAIIGVALCCLGPLRAEGAAPQLGEIKGTVSDPSGFPIAAATIYFVAGETRESTPSDGGGYFSLSAIPAQTYTVTAEANGFTALGARLVAVAPGVVTRLHLELARATTGSIATLGTVTVNGRQSISTSPSSTANLDPQRLAALGIQNVTDDLGQQIAVTMTRPAGGAPGLPQTASLRGPDPSETQIEVDGHVVNNANTGDFDLELLDPSEFSSIQVVYGIEPTSLAGANVQGGTINFHTLDPTPQDHGLVRLSLGNFDTSGYTLQATGTAVQRLGYALSFHHYFSAGAVNDYLVSYQPNPSSPATATSTIGSAINATSMLGKLRYSFGTGDGFIQATYRNTAAYRDLSAPLSFPSDPAQISPGALFTAFPGASALSLSPAWSLDAQVPIGRRAPSGIASATLTARHLTNIADQSAPGVPTGSNPYLLDDRDVSNDNLAEYTRSLPDGTLSLLAENRSERLTLPASAPFAPDLLEQSQTQRSYAARYESNPTAHFRYSMAMCYSRYDTFGTSIDPQVAVTWTPTADSVVAASF